MFQRILAAVLVAGLLVAALLFGQSRHEPLKVSGYIEADEIRLGSRVGGRVAGVFVEEGQDVAAGDRLVEFEPYDLLSRRTEVDKRLEERQAEYDLLRNGYRSEVIRQAKARVDQFEAQLDELRTGPRQQEIQAAEAQSALAREEAKLAAQNWERVRAQFKDGVVTAAVRDRAETDNEVAARRLEVETRNLALLNEGTRPEQIKQAEARLEEARAQLDLYEKGNRDEEIAAAYAAVEVARAERDALATQFAELVITAPADGTIEALELRKGDLVQANAPALSMVDTGRLWVRAYVPEDELDLATGQEVEVTVDSHPDRMFRGRVTFVARQAEFTPRNVQTPEERSKQVFRIKVTLEEGLDVLRPGMAADVWLEPRDGRPRRDRS